MSDNASLIPPDIPIPDLPFWKFIMKIPIILVGIFFIFYLLLLGYEQISDLLGLTDKQTNQGTELDFMEGDEPNDSTDRNKGIPDSILKNTPKYELFSHEGTNVETDCSNCHDKPAIPDANTVTILGEKVSFDDLPKDIDPELLDETKFREAYGLPPKDGKKLRLRDTISVGGFKGAEVCIECHTSEEFDIKHDGHVFQPLENCTLCHNMHDAENRFLLVDKPRDEICGQCHDPDH